MAPYEAVLLRAFDKLTSEIFLFLLTYLILVIGMAVLAPGLSAEIRVLIHVLPILGIAAFIWLKSGGLLKQAQAQGVSIWSGIATGSARVIGQRGGWASLLGRVKVRSGIATGQAQVIGIDAGAPTSGNEVSESYLLIQFRQLDEADRRKLIAEASRLAELSTRTDGKVDG